MSNILPKKCWHVGRPENVQRVQEDEERAKSAKELLEAKEEQAVRQRRLELLRKSASSPATDSNSSPSISTGPTTEHINLFKDEQDFQSTLTSSSRGVVTSEKTPANSMHMHMKGDQPGWYVKPKETIVSKQDQKVRKPLADDPALLFMKPSYFSNQHK